MDNTINTSSYINNYTNYCNFRLPCGICQRTNSICPLGGGTWTPTWTSCTTASSSVNEKKVENEDGIEDAIKVGEVKIQDPDWFFKNFFFTTEGYNITIWHYIG